MMVYTISNSNTFTYSNGFVFIAGSSKSTILTPSSETIYQGQVHVDNNSIENAYINLDNKIAESIRKIMIREMKELPANIIEIENGKIKITSKPIGTHIQIVEFPPFNEREHNTSIIIKDVITNETPCYIDFVENENEYDKEYIIWIDNQCAKIKL